MLNYVWWRDLDSEIRARIQFSDFKPSDWQLSLDAGSHVGQACGTGGDGSHRCIDLEVTSVRGTSQDECF